MRQRSLHVRAMRLRAALLAAVCLPWLAPARANVEIEVRGVEDDAAKPTCSRT